MSEIGMHIVSVFINMCVTISVCMYLWARNVWLSTTYHWLSSNWRWIAVQCNNWIVNDEFVSVSFLYCMSINYNALVFDCYCCCCCYCLCGSYCDYCCCFKTVCIGVFQRCLFVRRAYHRSFILCVCVLLFSILNSTNSTNRCVYVNLSNLAANVRFLNTNKKKTLLFFPFNAKFLLLLLFWSIRLLVMSWSFSLCLSRCI